MGQLFIVAIIFEEIFSVLRLSRVSVFSFSFSVSSSGFLFISRSLNVQVALVTDLAVKADSQLSSDT